MDENAFSIKGIASGVGAGLPLTLDRTETPSKTFGHFLMEALGEVDQKLKHSGDMTQRFAAGENLDVHQVMIASQQAGVAMNLTLQVRNKIVEAYQEIMRSSM